MQHYRCNVSMMGCQIFSFAEFVVYGEKMEAGEDDDRCGCETRNPILA
jgi:hypothetical protein